MTNSQKITDIVQQIEALRAELVEIDDTAFCDALVLLRQAERLVNDAKIHFEDTRTPCDMIAEIAYREQLANLRNPAYDSPDGIFTE